MRRLLEHFRIARFILVGFANAALHFTILNLAFYIAHQGKIAASIIATICAVTFSFFMNRNFVFRSNEASARSQVVRFVIVTLSGMLIVHNIAYIISLRALGLVDEHIISILKSVTGITFTKDFVDINMSTVVGAIFAMFWNYAGYKTFVFKGADENATTE